MKREYTPESEEAATPSPSSKKVRSSPTTPKDKKPALPSGYTPEAKRILVERLIAIGLQHAKADDLAMETGMSKKQISDATCKGKNNLRQKLIDFAALAPATGSALNRRSKSSPASSEV